MSGAHNTELVLSPSGSKPKLGSHINEIDLAYRQQFQPDDQEVVEQSRHMVSQEQNLRVVSVLRGVGPCLSPQLAALVGQPGPIYNQGFALTKALLEARILECCWVYHPGLPHPRCLVYRLRLGPSYFAWCQTLYLSGLSHRVTAGAPLMVHGEDRTQQNASRHQILAVETMLRALELSSAWLGWMPESTCSP